MRIYLLKTYPPFGVTSFVRVFSRHRLYLPPAKGPPFGLNECDQHSGGNGAGLRRIVCTLYPYEKYVNHFYTGIFSSIK